MASKSEKTEHRRRTHHSTRKADGHTHHGKEHRSRRTTHRETARGDGTKALREGVTKTRRAIERAAGTLERESRPHSTQRAKSRSEHRSTHSRRDNSHRHTVRRARSRTRSPLGALEHDLRSLGRGKRR